ncbi:MAG: hypothetical protein LBV65_04390 [Desulfovibrio sp.]|jgi:hypothetical protein|nr:hypothetical protein [Desulfovibrio sp.]
MKNAHPLFAIFLTTLLLAACGPSNNVRLIFPPPPDTAVLPASNAPRVSVVAFTDKRVDRSSLGARRDNTAFLSDTDPAQWISRAFADEMARSGMQISYAATVNEARKGNPDFLVTGEMDEAFLREVSATELSATLRVSYAVANRQARIMHDSINAGQTRTGLPSSGATENLMLDTLKDLIKPMARKTVYAIENKKQQ